MISRHIFFSGLIFLCSIGSVNADSEKENGKAHRRLIILSDDSEHVGKPAGALTGDLIGALQSAESPILVSVSLWQNLIEKGESLVSGAQLEEEEEKFAFDCAKTIRSMLDSDENSIESIGSADPIMAKQIVVDRINIALEALRKEGVKDPELSARVIDYLRCFQLAFGTNECDLYKVNSSYYLVIPKKYKNNCEQEVGMDKGSEIATSTESTLGLGVDHLELVADRSAIDLIHFDESECTLLSALEKIFLPSRDTSCVWDIYLSGHGGNNEWYQKNCPELSTIANMTPAEFKEVLNFFESNVSTNSFWYTTCKGGGVHMHNVVNTGGQSRSFPIVCLCLTDTSSYGHMPGVVGSLVKGFLTASDIEFDSETGKWKLVFTIKHKWNNFFSAIEDNSFSGNDLVWIRRATNEIAPSFLENIPLLLRAHSKDIITVYFDDCLRLSKEYCEYLQNASRSVLVDIESINFVLLDQLKLDIPYKIISKEVPLLVSVVPGKAIHHLTKIIAEESFVEQFLKMFRPLSGISFDKVFVVDEIRCKLDTEKKYGPLLQANKDGIVTLKDVVIIHKCDKLARFFFKNIAGDLFKVYTTCPLNCKKTCLHGFKKIENENVKKAYDVYRNKLIQV